MNEEELNDPYESELKKEKKAENERIEEAKDDLTEGKIRRQREGEGTRDLRKRIYPARSWRGKAPFRPLRRAEQNSSRRVLCVPSYSPD